MSEDMSNLMNQINNMIKNNTIPDEIKNMMNTLTNNTANSNDSNNFQKTSSPENSSSNNENNSIPEFDMATIMKMKRIMDSMKESRNDPRANLLKSLKPYLNESRKEKVDQYILGMGKVFEMLGPLGGEKKK